jgi:hypothetical protein
MKLCEMFWGQTTRVIRHGPALCGSTVLAPVHLEDYCFRDGAVVPFE